MFRRTFSAAASFFRTEGRRFISSAARRTLGQAGKRRVRLVRVAGTAGLITMGWFGFYPSDQSAVDPCRGMTPEQIQAYVDAEVKKNEALPVDPVQRWSKAPNVPPPIDRKHPARVIVDMDTTNQLLEVNQVGDKYPFWTFNGAVPGPFIRTRVGDELEVRYTNKAEDGIAHNIDFHSVTGPGGGAPLTLAEQGETKILKCKMLQPGLYVYHCAAAPVPAHVMNGMYGLCLVEPADGLPKVDKEFYVMQSEIYAEDAPDPVTRALEPSYANGLLEHPRHVVFNGKQGSLTENPLMCKQGDRVRIFFGNGGPNLISSFHIIGMIFDKLYREGDLISPPARGVQTTLVPAGGAAVVEANCQVPGNYTLVDHSVFRFDKGAIGFLKVAGTPRPDLYDSSDRPNPCPGCKLHN